MFKWFRKKEKNIEKETQTFAKELEQNISGDEAEAMAAEADLAVEVEELRAGEDQTSCQQHDDELETVAEAEDPELADVNYIEAEGTNAADTTECRCAVVAEDAGENSSKGLFGRFRDRLSATRDRIAGRMENLLSRVREIDDELLDELEEILITADLGIKTTSDLLFKIRGQVAKKELGDAEALKDALKKGIIEMLSMEKEAMPAASPLVLMVVGVNGVGKTTTIAKLAKLYIDQGNKVLLAAGDTFRSAAVDQLGIWAKRLGADIVAQPTGADAAAVVYDALAAAKARNIDIVLIDTAGRLHTKVNLMDELKKIRRVADKSYPGAPHHTILVVDGNTGQNALNQARNFNEAVPLDSVIITKLDGTAKGGVIVSISNELKIPVTYVGLGESFEDLQPFDAEAFTNAILGL